MWQWSHSGRHSQYQFIVFLLNVYERFLSFNLSFFFLDFTQSFYLSITYLITHPSYYLSKLHLSIYQNPLYQLFINTLSHTVSAIYPNSFSFLLCFDYLSNNSLSLSFWCLFNLSFITSDIYIMSFYFIQ